MRRGGFVMEIKILGPGCPRCNEVEKRTINALGDLNIAAEVQKVKSLKEISSFGVLATPGFVINGKVKAQGRIPSLSEIKEWIEQETKNM
jgi:small redox-active disulfide protein 2